MYRGYPFSSGFYHIGVEILIPTYIQFIIHISYIYYIFIHQLYGYRKSQHAHNFVYISLWKNIYIRMYICVYIWSFKCRVTCGDMWCCMVPIASVHNTWSGNKISMHEFHRGSHCMHVYNVILKLIWLLLCAKLDIPEPVTPVNISAGNGLSCIESKTSITYYSV